MKSLQKKHRGFSFINNKNPASVNIDVTQAQRPVEEDKSSSQGVSIEVKKPQRRPGR